MKSNPRWTKNILGAIVIGSILFGLFPTGIALAQPVNVCDKQSSDDPLPEDETGEPVQDSSEADPTSENKPAAENSAPIENSPSIPQEESSGICEPIAELQDSLPEQELPQEQNPIVEDHSMPDINSNDADESVNPSEITESSEMPDQAPENEEIASIVEALAAEEIVLTDLNDNPISLTSEVAVDALGSDPWFEEDGVKHGFVKPGESCPTFIDVCHNSDENPFQAAVDSAPVGKSTTIFVAAQHYETDVVINKPQLTLMVGTVHSMFGEDVWNSGEGSAVINRMTLVYELTGFSGMSVRDEVIVANDGVRLQQAVDLIEAGGTVKVAAGEYQGFKIKKSGIKVTGLNSSSPASGAGNQAPVIQSGMAAGNVGIEIDADNVSIEGFVFNGNDQAIQINDSNHVSISRNTFANNHWGVYVSGIESQDIQIHNNRFSQNNAAVENTTLSEGTTINAQQNWWGSNFGPSRLDIVGGDDCVGEQCGDWVIGTLDYSNWLKSFPVSTPDSTSLPLTDEFPLRTGFASVIIPVTGGQPVAMSCTSRCTILSLPGGEQIELCDLCGRQAAFQAVGENQMPDALPEGMNFISAINFDVQSIDRAAENLTQDIQASLLMNVPTSQGKKNYTVLMWDVSSDDGIGGWRELAILPVLLEQGTHGLNAQQAQIDVQGMGLFVLVEK